jgi:DNA end-binding protein Ku
MMARKSKTTIGFGLVAIPVKLQSLVRTTVRPSFTTLCRCGVKVSSKTTCVEHGEVPRSETKRGVEVAKGQYAVVTDDERAALAVGPDDHVAIERFVPIDQLDPTTYERSYVVVPEPGGRRAYSVLHAAMAKEGLAAIARYSVGERQYLVAMVARADRIIAHYLYYAFELRGAQDVAVPLDQVTPDEVKLATQLIHQKRRDLDHRSFNDESHARLTELIDAKRTSAPFVQMRPTPAMVGAQIVDLMGALKASVEKSVEAKTGKPKPAKRVKRMPSPRRKAAK